jgi:pleckstrin homology-like domain family B
MCLIVATSCRGYLNKVGAKPLFSMRANNRWFVFDREKQMFVYYSDKNEKKPRGGAYFNAITDVYFDHSSAMKNNRTFIVKTKSRMFTLQAPSQQACSIWIDVSTNII